MAGSELALASQPSFATPTIITHAGPSTRKKFYEFFTVAIRNVTPDPLIIARLSSFWNGIHDDGKDVDIRSCAKSFDRPPEAFTWRGLFITTGIMFSLRRP